MLMKEKLHKLVLDAIEKAGITVSETDRNRVKIEYPEASLGDYATNAAFIFAKAARKNPKELAMDILKSLLELNKHVRLPIKIAEVAPSGYINFALEESYLLEADEKPEVKKEKILLEYFQPNIAKPLHIGHMRTAIIGDVVKRSLLHVGFNVESDTHMGDWGTQFGYLILACKQIGSVPTDEELNKLYVELNAKAEKDPLVHEAAKQEFVKLEQGDKENRKIWEQLVEQSKKKFLDFAENVGLLAFENHWPESFYEDKMQAVVESLKVKKLLKSSQGAQIVDLENQGLGIAVIVKSDQGTTYLLRDLATFVFVKEKGFTKHLYVVDNRQSHHYKQLFAILKLRGEMEEGEGIHIDYGFMSFKGEVLSTRKGNMVLAEDVLKQAQDKVSEIIKAKNPDLKDKEQVIDAVSKAAIKYFDLSHNRHSDIEFDWDQALDFDGNSGPYLQYTYARLSSILRKGGNYELRITNYELTPTERELLFLSSILNEAVADSLQDYLPNVLANYLYKLASLANKFYHESPVIAETDESKKQFRLFLVAKVRSTLAQGLDLLGIKVLEEM